MGGGSSSGDSCIVVSPTKPADLENGLWIESDLVDKNINILNVEDMTSTSNITMEKLLDFPSTYYTNGGSIKINNIIYIFGGYNTYYSKSNSIVKYDILTNTYSVSNSTTPEQGQFYVIGRVSNKIYLGCSTTSRAIYDISNDTITTFDYTFDSTSIGLNTFFQTINNMIYVVIGRKFFSIDTINNIYTLIDGTTMPEQYYICKMISHSIKNNKIYMYLFYSGESLYYVYTYDYINNIFSKESNTGNIISGDFNYTPRKFCIDNKYMISYSTTTNNNKLQFTYKVGKILNTNIINKVEATVQITNSTELAGSSSWYPINLSGTTYITDDGFMYIHCIGLRQTTGNNTGSKYGIFRINYLGKYLQDINFINMYSDSIVVMLDKQSISEPHKDDYVPIIKNGNILEYNNIRYCFYINNNSTKLLKVHKIHNYNVIEYKNEYLDEVYTTNY